jgi:hypothetical protein
MKVDFLASSAIADARNLDFHGANVCLYLLLRHTAMADNPLMPVQEL